MPELSTGRKIVYASIPGAALIVIAFVAAETWLRAKYESIGQITGVVEWETATFRGLRYFWDVYHPRLGWTNAPNYESDRSVPFELTINGQGLRAPRDYDSRPPEGTVRVAMFGDSCLFGEEVDDDETVPFHAERWLTPAEVMNFGVHGYGLGQMVLCLEAEGFAFAPDHAVIVLLIPLDLARDPLDFFTHAKPRFAVVDGELSITNVPVPEASRQPWLLRNCYTAAWLFGRPPAAPASAEELGDQLDIAELLLARAAAACGERDVQLSLVLIVDGGTLDAMGQSAPSRQMVGAIRERLGGSGVDVLDLIDVLAELHTRTGGRQVAPHGHWKSDANRRIAEHIGRHLVAKDPRLSMR